MKATGTNGNKNQALFEIFSTKPTPILLGNKNDLMKHIPETGESPLQIQTAVTPPSRLSPPTRLMIPWSPKLFLKSLTKWSQMIASHRYGVSGHWNGSTYIIISFGTHLQIYVPCHTLKHLSNSWQEHIVENENISRHKLPVTIGVILPPFVAAPQRARWAIRGQNHCN